MSVTAFEFVKYRSTFGFISVVVCCFKTVICTTNVISTRCSTIIKVLKSYLDSECLQTCAFDYQPYFDPQQTMTTFVTVTVYFLYCRKRFLCNYDIVLIYCVIFDSTKSDKPK